MQTTGFPLITLLLNEAKTNKKKKEKEKKKIDGQIKSLLALGFQSVRWKEIDGHKQGRIIKLLISSR